MPYFRHATFANYEVTHEIKSRLDDTDEKQPLSS